jgi:predicted GNAT family N-acyltransferase
MNPERVSINVMCRRPENKEVLGKIRQWCNDDTLCKAFIDRVNEVPDLSSAIATMQRDRYKNILVTIGFQKAEVYERVRPDEKNQFEIIVHSDRTGQISGKRPSASFFETTPLLAGQDPIPFLRKSIIKLRTRQAAVVVRRLQSKEDFRAYFSLRYDVLKQMSYIPADKDCAVSQWELDYTDRTSHPIGAFSKDGSLIGCARLVRGLGEESFYYVEIIKNLIEERNDPKLRANFGYPRTLTHPFDLLESFPKFREYYHSLVTDKIPNAEVSRVIVKPEHRNYGLGEVIVDSLISVASQIGSKVLFLACRKEHQTFYERSGFRAIEGLYCDQFVNVNVPAIAMECRLRMS